MVWKIFKKEEAPPFPDIKPPKEGLGDNSKWEYYCVWAYYGSLSNREEMRKFAAKFNGLGKYGWEFVGVFNDWAWFKRKTEKED